MRRTKSKHSGLVIAAFTTIALAIAACSTNGAEAEGTIDVVATTSILGDIAANVVGEEGTVVTVMPLGTDAHDFSPSSEQTAQLVEADLVVANGLGLEGGMVDVLESAAADGTEMIELAPLVDPIPFVEPEGAGHEDGAGAEEHGALDPHFWMDPLRVGVAAGALAERLEGLYPGRDWLARSEAYVEEMGAADQRILGLVEAIPQESRKLVTNHEAFGYFANRYGFEIIGVVIPGGSTLAEPSSAELTALVDTMEAEGVKVIFAETSAPTTLADAVAAELGEGVEVVELFTESLGPAGSGGETLSAMLETNAKRITSALD
jgi:zinc/manganese transport system substrate-binding protein